MTILPPFWTLVEQHGAELLAHARKLSGDDAEDVLHDSLLKALRFYDRLQRADHLRAWLYRVVTTTAFDHSSARKRRPKPVDVVPESVSLSQGTDGVFDGEFDALIDVLPEKARDALCLRFVYDLSYDDIARRLGCSNQAARQRVSSAVRTLRRIHGSVA
jgi:RNA polymerase sigma-70 factor (ECF subfamily)